MSFEFGIGDFIQVIEVTQKIISKCKAATLEFRDLSRDVLSTQIVLDAVQRNWEQQKLNGRDLWDREKEKINELTQNCRDVLQDIKGLIQKHAGLEAGTGLLNSIKWLELGIWDRFGCGLSLAQYTCPSSTAMSCIKLAEEVRLHFHRQRLDLENDTTSSGIKQDLEKEVVDPTAIANEKSFVQKWIDDVILVDDPAHNDYTAADD